jgi:DNA ligase-1
MTFRELSQYLVKLEKTSSRNEITQILADLFKKTNPSEIEKTVYLLTGKLLPSYRGIELNIAERLMFQIIAKAYSADVEDVKKAFKTKGDLGAVVETFAKDQGKGLSIQEVYGRLFEVTQEAGKGSQEKKISAMAKLLSDLDPFSARFVARIPVGNIRLGFSDMTILDALSVMVSGDKSGRKAIEEAFNVNVDIGKIAREVKARGLSGLSKIKPTPGTPIRPTLSERLPSVEKILTKIGPLVAVEPKYDGFRAQGHIFKDKTICLFSRNLEDTTSMFPDLVEALKKVKVDSVILDGEIIACDPKTGKFLPFQETAQRKRKYDIEEMVKKLPITYFVFDILYKDGKSLLSLPFNKRRKILEATLSKIDTKVVITRQEITDSAETIRNLIKKYLQEGLEGAVIKKLDAPYKAGARGFHWIKYKKTTEAGVADTVDCLVMGIYRGRGKRAGFGVGAFLIGVKDGENFKTVSKIGTGLSDEQWRELDDRAKKLGVGQKPKEYEVNKNLEPDVWTKPSLVVEILADEITKSPIHSASLALRFPRLIKFRDEKGPSEATTFKELDQLFKLQKI